MGEKGGNRIIPINTRNFLDSWKSSWTISSLLILVEMLQDATWFFHGFCPPSSFTKALRWTFVWHHFTIWWGELHWLLEPIWSLELQRFFLICWSICWSMCDSCLLCSSILVTQFSCMRFTPFPSSFIPTLDFFGSNIRLFLDTANINRTGAQRTSQKVAKLLRSSSW